MYARLKPFRCQHGSRRGAAETCDYHVTRGYPDQFLTAVGLREHGEAITRTELIAALKQAHQSKVDTIRYDMLTHNALSL